MRNKIKFLLIVDIITIMCLGLLWFSTTQGLIRETGTAEAHSILGEWTVASVSPYIGSYAVGVTAAGDSIYIANSGAELPLGCRFMRYNTSTSGWDDLKMPVFGFKNAIAMAWDKGNYIYVLPGASYSEVEGEGIFLFYHYDITANTWTKLNNTPHTNGAGDALCFVPGQVLNVSGDNFLYAILGSNEPRAKFPNTIGSKFYRYSIANNSWSSELSFPWSSTDDGCSLVWTGDDCLYALRGEYIEGDACYDFRRYNITSNSWEKMADIPARPYNGGSGGVGDGGSLLWIGGNFSEYIYVLSGNQAAPESPDPIWDKRFYRYSITYNVWVRLADLPEGVGDQNGPRLGFVNGSIYCWRGCNGDGSLYAYQPSLQPEVMACDSTGAPQEIFDITSGDDVYVMGSNLPSNESIKLYVVQNQTWTDNQSIGSDVRGNYNTTSVTVAGILEPTRLGELDRGAYDIVADVNENGIYDEAVDSVDDVNSAPGVIVVPEFPYGTAISTILVTSVIILVAIYTTNRKFSSHGKNKRLMTN